ncbi:class I SAM-dependent methyltransferase [Nonomuraea sp. NPDC047897]|uniref:class I SAM-dependent methyltransferase n=1 Tax=Nonomuraea sp. NPDC047897 TaxID=3364346 RepID=UPI003719D269
MTNPPQMAQAFDELAGGYDNDHHDEVARLLLDLVRPAPGDRAADVACGNGAVALALARTGVSTPVLAVDISPGMVAVGRDRAERSGLAAAIDWRVGQAVPLPVPDASLDLVLCSSSLHFLGAEALSDWRRALRPGGRAGFTLPVASQFRPSGAFAALVASDVPIPDTVDDALSFAARAGLVDAEARLAHVGSRAVIATVATSP